MPSRFLRPCAQPGCHALSTSTRCAAHEAAHAATLHLEDARYRGSATERGYDHAWRVLRDAHIAQFPFCDACTAQGLQVQAREVDHVIPHRGDDALRLNPSNLRSLCASCHRIKTRAEGRGYRVQYPGSG